MKQIFYFLMCVFCLQAQAQQYPIELEREYEDVHKFHQGLALVEWKGFYGMINKLGQEIIPCIYDRDDNIEDWGEENVPIIVKLSGKYGVISEEGKVLVTPKYDKIEKYEKENKYRYSSCWAIVVLNGKYGLIGRKGEERIIPKYTHLSYPSENYMLAEINGKSGFINTNGKELIPFIYEEAQSFSEGLATVKLGGKWGFIDKTGKTVISCTYDELYPFSQGLAAVRVGKKWGFIDGAGKAITLLKYDVVRSFKARITHVQVGNKSGFIDRTGKEVTSISYNGIWEEDEEGGYTDETEAFEDGFDFHEGLTLIKKDSLFGFIDTMGREVIPPQYDDISRFINGYFGHYWDFSKGLVGVESKGKWGFIDKTGKLVVDIKYDVIDGFFSWDSKEGLYPVKLNGKWGFIDKNDKVVIPIKYDNVSDFSNGLVKVTLNNETSIIDRNNNIKQELYSVGWNFNEGLGHHIDNDKKYGFIDKENKIVIPCMYDRTSFFSEGIAAVQKDKKWSLIQNPVIFKADIPSVTPTISTLYYLSPRPDKCPYSTCESQQENYAIELGYEGNKTLTSSDLTIFLNGQVQRQEEKSSTRPFNTCGNGKVVCVSVKLSAGINEIEIKAGDKTTGLLKVRYNIGKPTLYFCGVGVSYQDNLSVKTLHYTEKDAQDIHVLYEGQKGEKRIFADVSSRILVKEEADKNGILGELEAYSGNFERNAIHAHDVFMLYLSGHGIMKNGKFYLLCQDYAANKQGNTAISEDELFMYLDKIKCKKLIFIDACREKMDGKQVLDEDKNLDLPINQAIDDLMAKLPGTTVFLSCKDGEKSKELAELQNGVFTYTLKKGLTGAADTDKDGLISIGEIKTYLETYVPKENPLQHPYIKLNELGDDTKIFVVK